MITDAFGNCSFSTQEVIELIYNGESVDQLTLDNEIESSLHKEHAKHFDITNCCLTHGLFQMSMLIWILSCI